MVSENFPLVMFVGREWTFKSQALSWPSPQQEASRFGSTSCCFEKSYIHNYLFFMF